MITEDEGKKCGFGSHVVTVLPHFMVKVSDGVQLAIKFWFPEENAAGRYFNEAESEIIYSPKTPEMQGKYPVVMEYIPYRKADFTSPRDYRRHTWLSSHGYVVARVDMRGSGDSEGVYYDEYLPQEQKDACEIIAWYAQQPWCNGKVGMYGKSWGGFNGLQVAYEQPPALKAVISLYSTDARYESDMHYEGGCILGTGMPSWAARMQIWNANPPCPKYNSNWKKLWKERLEKGGDPWLTKWMSHQVKDDYWKHASVEQDYSKIKAAVLTIGGWSDGYFEAVFRLIQNIPTAKGIVGPWPHDWPDDCEPGPVMDFMTECLNWWDHHLKDIKNEVVHLPKIRLFQAHSNPPATLPKVSNWPGQWLAAESWPFKGTEERIFFPDNADNKLGLKSTDEKWELSKYNSGNGLWCPEWLGWNCEALEGPFDERFNDELSSTWTTDVLNEDIKLCGRPHLTCTLKINNGNQGQIIARLCDIFPDGRSRYITRGILNLTHRDGNEEGQQKYLVPGEVYTVKVPLHTMAYVIPAGHKLRLSISPSYWPVVWTSNVDPKMEILTGKKHTYVTLPVIKAEEFKIPSTLENHMVATNPLIGPPLPKEIIRDGNYDVKIQYNPCLGTSSRTATFDSGKYLSKDTGTILDDFVSGIEVAEIKDGDPLSANVVITSNLGLNWPDQNIETKTKCYTKMWGTETDFHIISKIEILCNDELFFGRDWHDIVPRKYV